MPTLDLAQRRARFASGRVARLATVRPDGAPRLVPVTFALVDDLICAAVDELKPKRSTRLARLDDVRADPRVALIVDHYTEDWTALWWVRVDGTAAVHLTGSVREQALAALAAKYPPYAADPPDGPVLVVTPQRWVGWTAT